MSIDRPATPDRNPGNVVRPQYTVPVADTPLRRVDSMDVTEPPPPTESPFVRTSHHLGAVVVSEPAGIADARIATGNDNPEKQDPPPPTIEMASPERVLSCLPPERRTIAVAWPAQRINEGGVFDPSRTDKNHPLGQLSLATTKDSPAVLYDDTAAFCSPTLAFDEAGSAFHCHDSPLASRRSGDLERYFPELPNRVGEGRVTFVVGGSNVYVPEEEQVPDVANPIDKVVTDIEERVREVFPDADFYPLISKQHANQQSTHPAVPEGQTMRGFIFVPRYIAT